MSTYKKLHSVSRHCREKHPQITMKQMHARQTRRVKSALLVVCSLAVLAALTIFTISSVSAQAVPPISAAKQHLQQSQAQWHANVDQKKGPKGTISMSSCPTDLQHAAVIHNLTPMQMTAMHNAYASFASVISAEHKPYYIYGENGKFVVQALPLDPCKVQLARAMNDKQTFQSPDHTGNLIITSVQGDRVTYQTATGTTGSFNYVSGQF